MFTLPPLRGTSPPGEALEELLREEHIPIHVYPGMEIFGTYDTADLLREGRLLTLNGSRYPLIEFAFDTDGEDETEILQSVIDAGYTPLIAHPERYRCVCQTPELVNLWRKMGCLFQVNRGSLLGRYGHSAQQMSMALVRICAALVLANLFGLGALGVWIAMVLDWTVRSSFFLVRYRRGRWVQLADLHSARKMQHRRTFLR